MDQYVKIYEYKIKTQFNPVKFNQDRTGESFLSDTAKTSKVMFKNTSKKALIIGIVITVLVIALIIFLYVRNKKKKQNAEKEARVNNSEPRNIPKRPVRSSVIPKQDQATNNSNTNIPESKPIQNGTPAATGKTTQKPSATPAESTVTPAASATEIKEPKTAPNMSLEEKMGELENFHDPNL